MFLAARIKLEPTPEQYALLKDTLAQANQVCNWISQQAFSQKEFRQFGVHQLDYWRKGQCTLSFSLKKMLAFSIVLLANTFHFLLKWSFGRSPR
jgi:hypothetical protein